MPENVECPCCGSTSSYSNPSDYGRMYNFSCREVCGDFFISHGAFEKINTEPIAKKIGMVVKNIQSFESGLKPYWCLDEYNSEVSLKEDVTPQVVSSYLEIPMRHSDKLNNLLLLQADALKGHNPFAGVALTKKDFMKLGIVNRIELFQWQGVLRARGFLSSLDAKRIEGIMQRDQLIATSEVSYSMTGLGWQEVEKLKGSINSKNAFVAMQFTGNSDRVPIQNAVEEACSETGWIATTIDREEYLGGISDEIIAKINQSQFIVADFTGQNHGVYYEAGYAQGRNIPVIYTVRESDVTNLHFDTQHLNHIVWSDFDDLKEKLKNRIAAVINK